MTSVSFCLNLTGSCFRNQVPQNFVGVELKTDYLDMQNEYLFRYVNCIR